MTDFFHHVELVGVFQIKVKQLQFSYIIYSHENNIYIKNINLA